MLGSDLVRRLRERHEVFGVAQAVDSKSPNSYQQADIRDGAAVGKVVREVAPEWVIHTAAYTDVDGCEVAPKLAFDVNALGTRHVAAVCKKIGARIAAISTDYVYAGEGCESMEEDAPTGPVSVYGKSKLLGESYLRESGVEGLIIRTSWLYGSNGRNFFKTIIQTALTQNELEVVSDQFGAPTYTADLAAALVEMLDAPKRLRSLQTYHFANSGVTTWFEAARELLMMAGMKTKVYPISSSQLTRKARRPLNSRLSLNKLLRDFSIQPRPWNDALASYWQDSLQFEGYQMRGAK
jgi:dTDP-4-dehydrorhamnose reductase